MKQKAISVILLLLFSTLFCKAQDSIMPNTQAQNISISKIDTQDKNILNHLDFSLTVGSTGLGFDIAMPIGNYVQIRTGLAFIPHFRLKMNYQLGMTGEDANKSNDTFSKASELLSQLTNQEVRPEVAMWAVPDFNNFKLLVDIFPFKNKQWHLTTGFYLGGENYMKAYNRIEDMTNLVAVNLYNNIVTKLEMSSDIVTWNGTTLTVPEALRTKALSYGKMAVKMGTFKHDVIVNGQVKYQKGEEYELVPSSDNMIYSYMKVNRFKPYLGLGYGGPLDKNGNTTISFDAGIMFWGGTPKLITHEGVDLIHDLDRSDYSNEGDISRTINLVKKFLVYPVLSIRITQRIF